jgi:4'-phosphopantetheinyl transferase
MDNRSYPIIRESRVSLVSAPPPRLRPSRDLAGLVGRDALVLWPQAQGDFNLGEEETHIWAVSLDLCPSSLARFAGTLSGEELHRAARFRFDGHRDRFIAGRGWLRLILGCYADLRPGEIRFEYGPYGKPRISNEKACGIEFNLAHSENLGLVSVTRTGPVGVDIERICVLEDFGTLVRRFFSARESALFDALDPAEQTQAFFNLWTRKEALLKATGLGISHYLNQVEVAFLPGEPAALLALPDFLQSTQTWALRELTVAPGFAGALASIATQVCCRHWHEKMLLK